MMTVRPNAAFVASHPAHLIALGFGAGLMPRAPGTAGTLLAWLLGYLLSQALAPGQFIVLIGALFVLGIWACRVTGQSLGASDHGAMVWDEMVAFLLVLAVVPPEAAWQAAGFVLFRIMDIGKPPPIRWLERRHRGGFGVMVDDVLAAGYALVVLALARRLIS